MVVSWDFDGMNSLWFHQTWLARKSYRNGALNRKINDKHGPFSSKPCLMKPEGGTTKCSTNSSSLWYWLVVYLPLWKIWVSWDYHSPYMEKKNMFQTTNQAVTMYDNNIPPLLSLSGKAGWFRPVSLWHIWRARHYGSTHLWHVSSIYSNRHLCSLAIQ